jgi:hypothetical protein
VLPFGDELKGGGCLADPGDAVDEGGAGVLGRGGPVGNVEGCGGVGGGGPVGVVLVAELALDDGPHGGAFGFRGAFPVEAKTLTADTTLDVLHLVGLLQQNPHVGCLSLHYPDFSTFTTPR